jgi:hypothetical protein
MINASRHRAVPRNTARSWLAAALAAVVAMGIVAATPRAADAAQSPVGLGTATSYAVLAGSAVTNTGPTVVAGNLGVSPGSSVTGFPPGVVVGTIHAADAAAIQAQVDQTTAYNDAAGRTPVTTVPTELGGTTLTPGVYTSAAGTLEITGNLTLNAQGDPHAVFIFQAASTLKTMSASTVTLIGGAQACNVFWQVGSSATLGTSSSFVGTILALTSITVTTGVTVNGRLLAGNGAVTLDSDTIKRSDCAIPPPDRTTATTVTSSAPTAQVGTPVTFTATVTSTAGLIPTGTVAFSSDGVGIGSAPLGAGGQASLTVATLPAGTHQIVATYSGSALLNPSTSPPLTQVIVGPIPPPTPPLTPSPPVVVPGGSSQTNASGSAAANGEEGKEGKENIGNVKEAKTRAHKHQEWDRIHHRKDHGRLVTIQTLHTLHGVISEDGHGGHHNTHRSWSSRHPGHHHAHKKAQKHQQFHVRHKRYPKQRAMIAVTG